MLTSSQVPLQSAIGPLIPSADNPNSYGGLFVLTALAVACIVTRLVIRTFANNATRRSPAWDCGYPDPRPTTQYTSTSFTQPIRRVFGTVVFGAREIVAMPKPGDVAAASLRVTLTDPAWDKIYTPIAQTIGLIADRMNGLQFLTIRRYLGLIFLTLVFLLAVLALWT